MPDPQTEEMHVDQIRRAKVERARAEQASDDTEEHTHARRAERAAYLAEKLEERAEAEDARSRDR